MIFRFFNVITLSLICFAVTLQSSYGYNAESHEQLSEEVLRESLPIIQKFFPIFGLESLNDKLTGLEDRATAPTTQSVERWILQGALDEDFHIRYFSHFYDPINGLPAVWPSSIIAPAWAIEGGDEIKSPFAQDYSLRDAATYLYQALTHTEKEQREAYLAKTFYALGHVIHMVEDAASPPHVRNDSHGGALFGGKSLHEIYTEYLFYSKEHKGESEEESYKRRARVSRLLGLSYPQVTLPTAYSFWSTTYNGTGQGLAEFTNRNFITEDTNFDSGIYDNPSLNGAQETETTIQALYAEKGQSVPYVMFNDTVKEELGKHNGQEATITFIGTRVVDNYTGKSEFNPRTSTYSIFNADLDYYNTKLVYDSALEGEPRFETQHLYTLNRFNIDNYLEFLVPRAIAYATGLVEYFFRGKLEISPPDEGVYAIVDHATVNKIDQGFTRLKLKLTNITPNVAEIPQHLWPGSKGNQLVAVAKYYRNPCYRPDLTGEYKEGTYQRWNGCTATDEQEYISISQPVKDISLPNGTEADFTFEFDTPIPLNAINLSIQVIYQGYVGEDQAVVVATKDISEPSFLSVMNLFDHLLIEDTFYSFEEIENTDSLLQTLLQNGWSTPIYSNDIINFQLVVAPHKKTIATVTEQMIPGDYFRLGLLLEPENTACTFYVDMKISDVDMYFSASMNNMLIPQHYQVDTYPAFGASEVRGSYHTSLKPFTFNGINIRPANEWDYSKMALPLSGKYTPVPVTVYF